MPVRARLRRIYYKAKLLVHRAKAQVQPHDQGVRLKIAADHVQREEWLAALDQAKLVLQAEPEHALAHRLLAQAQQGLGQTAAARQSAQTALALDATSPWTHQVLGQLYLTQQAWSEAITAFQTAVSLDPQSSWLQFSLGEALVRSGQWSAAIPVLSESIKLNPVFPWAYYYLGEAKLALGDLESAKSLYQKAQLFGPDIEDLRGNVAYVEHLQQQDQRIQAYLDRVQKLAATRVRSRPRVLLVTPGPPYPPKSGGAMRMFYEMQALHGQVDLVVASLLYAKNAWPVTADLGRYAELAVTVYPADPCGSAADQPQSVVACSSQRFRQLLQRLSVVNFDAVVIDFVQMAQYRDLFPQALRVLAEHNIESQIIRRNAIVVHAAGQDSAMLEREADRLAMFEDQVWPDFPLRFVVSQQDQQQLQQRCDAGETIVVNNGANTGAIPCLPDHPVPRVLLTGTLHYLPNVDGATFFVNEILPHIWAVNPQVEFWLAGAKPSPEVWELADRDDRIKIVANPEQMIDVARECCLSVVPLRIGSGTRIKILEALAMGLPSVTTSLGCEGLAVEDDQHVLIRDQPDAFATAVLQLLNDQQRRDRLRRQGRQLVEQQYDWQQIFRTAIAQMLDRLPRT